MFCVQLAKFSIADFLCADYLDFMHDLILRTTHALPSTATDCELYRSDIDEINS